MKLPIIDNQVALTSDADDLSDVFLGGVRYENSATPKVRATTVSGQYQANGLSFDATGRVFYTDATAGLPAGTTFAGGLPFSPSGALCVSSDAVSTWGNGIPFAANGAVSALFASSALTFGVTLSSVVGGLPASGDGIVTINQVANAITPVITVSRSTGVAPLAVTFDALGTTAPAYTSLPFSEIYYAWTFGDPAGGATWAYGTNPGGNLKNEANGPVAAHVFETDGSYTVTCWAFYLDSGGVLRSGSATTSITVTNADTVYASNTLYAGQSSAPVPGVDGVPPGATCQHVPNWATFQTLAATYKRILLRRGDTWTASAGSITISAGAGVGGTFGAHGLAVSKPIVFVDLNQGGFSFSSGGNDWRVMDIKITATPSQNWGSNGRGIVALTGQQNLLCLRVDVEHVGRIQVESGESDGFYLVDSIVGPSALTPSICTYATRSDRMALLGNRIFGSQDHGTRWQGAALSVISNNTFDTTKTGSHVLTIRGKGNDAVPGTWTGLWTEDIVVSDNVLDGVVGNIAVMAFKPVNADSAERLRDIIFERNFVRSIDSEAISAQVSETLTIRNNIILSQYEIAIGLTYSSNVGSPAPTSGYIYNNSIYKVNSTYSANFNAVNIPSSITGYSVINNTGYSPTVASATFFGGSGVLGVNYTASNNSTDTQVRSVLPFVNASPVVAADFAPAGYAVNGGAWVPVYKNYFLATVTTPREIGAI